MTIATISNEFAHAIILCDNCAKKLLDELGTKVEKRTWVMRQDTLFFPILSQVKADSFYMTSGSGVVLSDSITVNPFMGSQVLRIEMPGLVSQVSMLEKKNSILLGVAAVELGLIIVLFVWVGNLTRRLLR